MSKKVAVVLKDREPFVIEAEDELNEYNKILSKYLSEDERKKSPINGLDFFSADVHNISGIVEEYSACHPYERNRDWSGPAILFQFDEEGNTVSLDDEHFELIKKRYGLQNKLLSPSQKINNFLNKYLKPEILNLSFGNFHSVISTADIADVLRREKDKGNINEIESILDSILVKSNETSEDQSALLNEYLRGLGVAIIKKQAEDMEWFTK